MEAVAARRIIQQRCWQFTCSPADASDSFDDRVRRIQKSLADEWDRCGYHLKKSRKVLGGKNLPLPTEEQVIEALTVTGGHAGRALIVLLPKTVLDPHDPNANGGQAKPRGVRSWAASQELLLLAKRPEVQPRFPPNTAPDLSQKKNAIKRGVEE